MGRPEEGSGFSITTNVYIYFISIFPHKVSDLICAKSSCRYAEDRNMIRITPVREDILEKNTSTPRSAMGKTNDCFFSQYQRGT